MGGNDDGNESMAMLLRRATHVDIISAEIALCLAEMLFVRHYSQEQTNEQLPLVVVDRGARWEVHGREGAPHRLVQLFGRLMGAFLNS
jgi:hypothetical protein